LVICGLPFTQVLYLASTEPDVTWDTLLSVGQYWLILVAGKLSVDAMQSRILFYSRFVCRKNKHQFCWYDEKGTGVYAAKGKVSFLVRKISGYVFELKVQPRKNAKPRQQYD